MSAISSLLSSATSFRSSQGVSFSSGLQPQAQRGTSYGSTGAVRGGGNTANASSAYCPTCGGGANAARSSSSASSSYCPTCNTSGGRQSNITSFNSTPQRTSSAPTGAANSHAHQGGRICVGCAYQGR